jgi:hypothetical protein
LPVLLAVFLSAVIAGAADARKPTPTATPAPRASPAGPGPKATPKRVFTNDDLEAAREKPSAVQDLSATGAAPYEPPQEPLPDSPSQPIEDPGAAAAQQIAALEATIKSLDEQANQLLWGYLQSTDTNEILRLKAEQKEVLDRKKEAEAELARIRSGAAEPAPTPTREPG